jgi:hypothetical protein
MFWVPRTGSDGDDWRDDPPPPDNPPRGPEEPGPFDWNEFDRLRAVWGRTRIPTR